MKGKRHVHASCEMDSHEMEPIYQSVKNCLDEVFRSKKVTKAEVSLLTGLSKHTCCDSLCNYHLSSLVVLFRCAARVSGAYLRFNPLLEMLSASMLDGTELVVRRVPRGAEPAPGERKILVRLPGSGKPEE